MVDGVGSALPDLGADRKPSREEIECFHTKGHVCIRALAAREEIEAYAPRIERVALEQRREERPLEERDTYGRAFLQMLNLWLHDTGVARFVLAERFARVASELLGVDRVRLYHDQALFKEAHGGATPWHQDQFYWPLDTDATITMWMPLRDASAEMGTMRFASGVHQRGHLGEFSIGDESDAVFAEFIEREGIAVEDYGALAAGDATFHHGWSLHSAPANATGEMRPAMTIIYFADGAHVAPLDHPNRRLDQALWLPGRQAGERADTRFNPVVWPAPELRLDPPRRDAAYWEDVGEAARSLHRGSGKR